ncbi:PLP-dependent transferase [Vararia minispora EC-137]|uniref:PLP-dependent transferase n=1 Tax=Vararia minispora EC-137 TaxID=1314806 RepID=A0ACB8QW51_9AGAM|nr:PLP-dependent transferase [Vararia minispora EC-137]
MAIALQDSAVHPVGEPIPPYTDHAISVSLPKWEDNVGYEEGDPRVLDVMQTGYPRFFIHKNITKLASICASKFGTPSESAMLFPTARSAEHCRVFVAARSVPARVTHFAMPGPAPTTIVYAVLFPTSEFGVPKQFWQHTGLGISSRRAEHCLALLAAHSAPKAATKNKHYTVKPPRGVPSALLVPAGSDGEEDTFERDQALFLEERYGRNLSAQAAEEAKRAMKLRIAGVLVRDERGEVEVGVSVRGASVQESDVYLYPTGMSAIWSAHQLALGAIGERKSICFGFPYTDTLKTLQKWGPGCHFLGNGVDSDIDELEKILADEHARDPSTPPTLALFTEFPSNPLLRSANLPRLRQLADKYDFLIVIDDTIGNFVNVEALPYADIMVSSLSKIFSGEANVMGGSLVLNPARKHYAALKTHQDATFENAYFDADAIFMERNSRDFQRRIAEIDANTEALCDLLHAASVQGGDASSPLTRVYYPKYETAANYEACRIKRDRGGRPGGFGGLFSVDFSSRAASAAFFDALPCFKGPSLGTNFTLACPYTIIAHYVELPWAARYGVNDTLVRVSVGMQDREELVRGFEGALAAARAVAAAE